MRRAAGSAQARVVVAPRVVGVARRFTHAPMGRMVRAYEAAVIEGTGPVSRSPWIITIAASEQKAMWLIVSAMGNGKP